MTNFYKIIAFLLSLNSMSLQSQVCWELTSSPDIGFTNSFALDLDGRIYQALCTSIIYSDDNGDNWNYTNFSFPGCFPYSMAINSSGHIFAGTGSQGIFRSTDKGNTWQQFNSGLTDCCVRKIVINSKGQLFLSTKLGGVFTSIDNGETWKLVNSGLNGVTINCFIVDSKDVIYAGTDIGGIYRTINNGLIWTRVSTGLPTGDITNLAINKQGHIFAGNKAGKVFRTIDNANKWTQCVKGLNTMYAINGIVINSLGHIYAAAIGGIFRSLDNGDTWLDISAGLKNTYIVELGLNARDQVFVAFEIGVCRSKNVVSSIDKNISESNNIILGSNYPNPVFSSTSIPINLSHESHIQLIVTDMLGNPIETLVNQTLSAGKYHYQWNADMYPSGIYTYKLSIGQNVFSRKMNLIR
ncbi:MAG: T9SS type A sorting domain-containing protein [Saprospiraceae bacterium]|nr:T9SS type A sorting domain-containing protein [Saprospiraceae bacterium]